MTKLDQHHFFQASNDVAAEVMDGEALIIKVSTGVYYNTEGCGGWIWQYCSQGVSLQMLLDTLIHHFSLDADQTRTELYAFIEDLQKESLLIPIDKEMTNITIEPLTEQTYITPTLQVYRDMQDLLALDPPMPIVTTPS
ncbi:PqqD family peptide modification chaperone [Magnetococcales bacterium HHB-1]